MLHRESGSGRGGPTQEATRSSAEADSNARPEEAVAKQQAVLLDLSAHNSQGERGRLEALAEPIQYEASRTPHPWVRGRALGSADSTLQAVGPLERRLGERQVVVAVRGLLARCTRVLGAAGGCRVLMRNGRRFVPARPMFAATSRKEPDHVTR